MTTYEEATLKLGNRSSRKLQNNTYLQRRSADTIAVMLHATDVVTYTADGRVQLNSGGWRTPTTKDRLGTYAPGFVSQNKGQWYWQLSYDPASNSPIYIFTDGMAINVHDGFKVTGADLYSPAVKKSALKLRRRVRKYAADFIDALAQCKIPAPDNGDCFFCRAREIQSKTPIGEINHNPYHILSHLKESYYVPSLLQRAIEIFPVSQVARWFVSERWQVPSPPAADLMKKLGGYDDIAIDQLRKSLSRYMLRQLGQAS